MSVRKRRSIFDIFDDFFKDVEEMFEEEFERLEKLSRQPEKSGPIVYGFRMTIGPDGVPHIQEFGNIKRVGAKPKISEEREPLYDIIESGNMLTVVVELPGVEKEKIDVKVVDNKLVIRASNGERKYYKEIELPKPVKAETAKAQYKNGVLEIKLELKEPIKEEGTKIKVE